MEASQTSNDMNGKASEENMERRIKNLFSGQEPPSYESIREVEAMKARIRELETELAQQANLDQSAAISSPASKTGKISVGRASIHVQEQESEKSRLPRFLAAPVFEGNPETTRTAKLLHQVVMASWFLPLIAVLVSILNPSVGRFVRPVAIMLAIALVLIMFLNRAGKLRLAGYLIVATVLFAATYLNYSGAGEPRPLLLLTVIAIMMSGLLLGVQGPMVVAILLAAQHIIILSLSAKGLIMPQSAPPAPLQNGLVTTVSYLLIGFLLQLVIERIQFAVNRLREEEAELEIKNRELQQFSSSLEQRVAARTHDLELAAAIGRAVSEKVGNLSDMLTHSVELIRSSYELYHAQIYLLDASGRNLVLRAGTGEPGIQLLRRGHHLMLSENALNSRAASTQKPVLMEDTQKSENFLPNPLLPLTRSELVVPLIANNQVVGVLDMQNEKPETFSEANIPAFEVLAGQLAIAIQNSALFNQIEEARLQVEEQARRLTSSGWHEFLNAVDRSESIGYVFSQEEVLPLVETQTAVFDNTLVVPIQMRGENLGEMQLADQGNRRWTSVEAEIVKAAVSSMAQHLESLRLLAEAERYREEAEQISRRLTSDGWNEYFRTRKELGSGYRYNRNEVQVLNGNNYHNSASTLTYPVMVHDEPIGVMLVDAQNSTDHNPAEVVGAVVEQLSSHIEGLRLLEQAELRRLELQTVATVSATVSTVLDPDQLLQAVVDMTKERFNLYHAHIYLANEGWNTLLLSAGAGEIGRQMVAQEHAISMDAEKSLVARAAREHRSMIVNDVRNQPDFLPNPLLPDTRAEMAVPMIVGDKVLGVFDVQSAKLESFSNEDAAIYTTLASQVAIALQNARLYVEQAATVTQLRELDRLKSSFLANMSHELRTPLNSILGFTDVMLEGLDGELTEYMDNDLRLIQKNGQHLLHLINDVLDMAKIESGRMNLHPETFKIHSVLDEVVSITSTLASEKNVALFIEDASDREIEIYADNTRLRQVVINLVNNSIKFTEKGKISVCTKPMDGGRLLITVKDTGIGIPSDKLEAIFQEFTQVDSSTTRKVGGTGLGLPISRRLVEMHGGRLWAESTGIEGEGSTFYVELPIEARLSEVIEKQEK